MKKEYKIEGMKCKNCVLHVEEALKNIEGIKKAKASLDKNNVIIDGDNYKEDEIVDAISKLGFKIIL